jgi:hypothetical protein
MIGETMVITKASIIGVLNIVDLAARHNGWRNGDRPLRPRRDTNELGLGTQWSVPISGFHTCA